MGDYWGIPMDWLRFDQNQALFFLWALSSDLLWCYRVKEVHPKNKPFPFVGGCCLCEWEPIGLDLYGLVDCLIEIGH